MDISIGQPEEQRGPIWEHTKTYTPDMHPDV
jgi:hypothetical protein